MAKKTQQRPPGVFSGRLYGSFAGKPPEGDRPVGILTQQRPPGVFSGRRYGSFAGRSGAATISAAYGTPTGGTTATVGCTTDTASGALWALVRIGGSPAADTAIEAGGQSAAVSTTTPSIAYTGLTAATAYSVDIVQKVGGVYSSVITTTFTTDNTGSGGGDLASDAVPADGVATVSAVGASLAAATATSAAGAATVSATGASLAAASAVPAAGAATVSAIGDTLAPGETTAVPAAGSAAVSAIGASIAAASAVPSAGSCTVSAVGESSGTSPTAEVILLASRITTAASLSSRVTTQVALLSHI